jgi:hypothetical protein
MSQFEGSPIAIGITAGSSSSRSVTADGIRSSRSSIMVNRGAWIGAYSA